MTTTPDDPDDAGLQRSVIWVVEDTALEAEVASRILSDFQVEIFRNATVTPLVSLN